MGLTPDRRIRLNRMFTATEFLAQILLNWIYLIRLYGKIYQMGETRCHSWSIEDGSRRLNGWWFVVWIGCKKSNQKENFADALDDVPHGDGGKSCFKLLWDECCLSPILLFIDLSKLVCTWTHFVWHHLRRVSHIHTYEWTWSWICPL